MSDFGTRLRNYRLNRGMTQTQVQNLGELNVGYMSGLESGRRNPSRDMVERLIVAMDLSPVQGNSLRESAGFASQAVVFASDALGRLDDRYRNGTDRDRVPIDFFTTMLADRLDRSQEKPR